MVIIFINLVLLIKINLIKISVEEDAKLLLLEKRVQINDKFYVQVVKAKFDFDIAKQVI